MYSLRNGRLQEFSIFPGAGDQNTNNAFSMPNNSNFGFIILVVEFCCSHTHTHIYIDFGRSLGLRCSRTLLYWSKMAAPLDFG